jgi:hypothetical protein
LNGILSLQTGAHWEPFRSTRARLSAGCFVVPFDAANCANSGGDYNLDGVNNDRPNSTVPSFQPTKQQWADGWNNVPGASAPVFSTPCLGCVGNLGRNTFSGPKLFTMDMSLFKNFTITERVGLQFRVESFNLFNHTNFKLPGSNFAGHNRINDGNFGQASGAFDPRQLQFGLKLSF